MKVNHPNCGNVCVFVVLPSERNNQPEYFGLRGDKLLPSGKIHTKSNL